MKSIEVPLAELEEIAYNSGAPIEFPAGGTSGWARLVIADRRYHSWFIQPAAVEVCS
jgi:hypothetical protein